MKKGFGIYIGRKEVVAAAVSISGGVPSLVQYTIEPIQAQSSPQTSVSPKKKKEPGKKELSSEAQTVERALQKIGALKSRVVAAFNPLNLVTRYFEIPFVPSRERLDAARYEATRYIPFKLDETVADFHITERKNKSNENILGVTCAAARLDILRSHVDHLRRGSAKVDMVEPVFSAFSRALSVSEKTLGEGAWGFIFIDGNESVNVTLVSRGMVYLSRDFLLSPEDARANETRFYEELKASFDYMKKASGEEHLGQIFLGGTGDLLFWRDFLTSVFGAEVRFELGSFPAAQNIPATSVPGLLTAIGLGLRSLNYKSPLGNLALLPPAEFETKPERLKKKLQFEFLFFAIFFIVFRFAILNPYAGYVQKQVLSQMNPEAAGDTQLTHVSVSDLTKTRDELQSGGTQIEKLLRGTIRVSAKLSAISQTMPKAIWLEQLNYESGLSDESSSYRRTGSGGQKGIVLRGQCYLANAEEDVKAIDQWVRTLSQDKTFLEGFRKIAVTEVRREKYLNQDTTMFSISCQ